MNATTKSLLDKALHVVEDFSRTTLGVTALTVLVLSGAAWLLFHGASEFLRLAVFAIVVVAYFGFLFVTGRA